jgi:plastocyanin
MNLTRIGVFIVSLGIVVTVGCASRPPFPESSLTGGLFEVKIGETLTPSVVTAKRGDEVRWVNTTSGPVDVLFYAQSQVDLISCQKGFGSTGWGYLFGSSEHDFLVVATVHPNDSASLCFAIPGTYVYGVRWHPPITGYPTRITGSVTIE